MYIRSKIILCLIFCYHLVGYSLYSPQLELIYRGGNFRHIGRLSGLVPLWQKENQLLYFNLIGMLDSKNAKEMNAGFGYRKLLSASVLGGYGYYDRRKSDNDIFHQQLTLGLEWLAVNYELRFNGYIPLNKEANLTKEEINIVPSVNSGNLYLSKVNSNYQEQPLGGFDVEGGIKLGNLPIMLYGGYYHFNKSNIKPIQGPRGRIDIKLNKWLKLTGEIQYDDYRKFIYSAGVELRLGLDGKKDKSFDGFSLHSKMTQMPVRDVDVVVNVTKNQLFLETKKAELIEKWKDLDKIRANLKGVFAIVEDIEAPKGNKHVPIGLTITNSFSGIMIGVSIKRDRKGNIIKAAQNEKREIRYEGLSDAHIKHTETTSYNPKSLGFFGYVSNAHIGYLSVSHPRILVKNSYHMLGGVVGSAINSTIEHVIHSGDILSSDIIYVGGIVGSITHSIIKANRNKGLIIGNKTIGGIAGTALNDNKIYDNFNIGKIQHAITSPDKMDYGTGGIVGDITNNNHVENNTNEGEISGASLVGGIVGHGQYNNEIRDNTNKGKISGISVLGGIVGKLYSNNKLISNHNDNTISGSKHIIGGIAGTVIQGNTVCRNVNTQQTSGQQSVGGIVGLGDTKNNIYDNENQGNIISQARGGGIAGNIDKENIVSKNINRGEVSGQVGIGGIIGIAEIANTITKNTNYSNIIVSVGGGSGIVGLIMERNRVIDNINKGNVTGDHNLGGIVGMSFKNNFLLQNINEAIVSGTSLHIGGIVGTIHGKDKVCDNKNQGNVVGSDFVGGIVGFVSDGNSKFVESRYGKKVADKELEKKETVLESNENSGEVSGRSRVGGIVGELSEENIVTSNTNNGKISGIAMIGGISGEALFNNTIEGNGNNSTVTGRFATGGIIGSSTCANKVIKNNNYQLVIGDKKYVGGIVGQLKLNNTVQSNNNMGEVGRIKKDSDVRVGGRAIGGIIGWVELTNIIAKNKNQGKISGQKQVDGIVGGFKNPEEVENSNINKGEIISILDKKKPVKVKDELVEPSSRLEKKNEFVESSPSKEKDDTAHMSSDDEEFFLFGADADSAGFSDVELSSSASSSSSSSVSASSSSATTLSVDVTAKAQKSLDKKLLKFRGLQKYLEKHGYKPIRQSGSHVIFENKEEKKSLSVPYHSDKTLKRGLLQAIISDVNN